MKETKIHDLSFLSDDDWQTLLLEIRAGQVIPVVGPGMVTVPINETGTEVPLHQYLAPALAKTLDLDDPQRFLGYNDIAREYLLKGGRRERLYEALRLLLTRMRFAPPRTLVELSSITDFDLFVACTPDPLLALAVQQSRPDFSMDRGVIQFHPQGKSNRSLDRASNGSVQSLCDLPENPQGPLVYHILGDFNTWPDFAVWEEDYMEFICGLIEKRDTLKNLFEAVSTRSLLLLGAPSEDWIVRFFLRAARGKRLSDLKMKDYLADTPGNLGEPMIFFFDKAVRATRIIEGEIHGFVGQLSNRWHETFDTEVDSVDFLNRQPADMPRGSVFISYSRDDLAQAIKVAQTLSTVGVPVWLDKQRLQPGENFARSLEHTIKDSASFFISLVSNSTESDATRYVHQERRWAAQKHVDGFVFYIPLIIDQIEDSRVQLEPDCFRQIHRERMSPESLPLFAARIKYYVDAYRDSGRPRG